MKSYECKNYVTADPKITNKHKHEGMFVFKFPHKTKNKEEDFEAVGSSVMGTSFIDVGCQLYRQEPALFNGLAVYSCIHSILRGNEVKTSL